MHNTKKINVTDSDNVVYTWFKKKGDESWRVVYAKKKKRTQENRECVIYAQTKKNEHKRLIN